MLIKRLRTFLSLSLLVLVLSACGWHQGEGGFVEDYQTITIPFATGDWQGLLTQALVNEVATHTSLDVLNHGGDLTLLVNLKEIGEDNVGFRYDRNKKGKIIHYIIPTETRITAFAEVTLFDQATGIALFGPTLFEASCEFDHDYYTSRNSVNIFSLGQVTDYDQAYDAALKPLYQNLAIKITDYMKSAW